MMLVGSEIQSRFVYQRHLINKIIGEKDLSSKPPNPDKQWGFKGRLSQILSEILEYYSEVLPPVYRRCLVN